MSNILFIPHGGGPLPLLGDPAYASLAKMLKGLNATIANAKAVIVVSAHWETECPGLSAEARPGMLYDYYGFPQESYEIQYPAPGAPDLAETVGRALAANSIEAEFDHERGFDHGTFVPMALIRPEADIPILQMSVLSSLDPARHLAVGRALTSVLDDDIALVGSGFSFHNLKALTGRLTSDEVSKGQALAVDFHDWLDRVICDETLQEDERNRELIEWASKPGARFCQPREEHLLPLHVCVGAADALGLTARSIFSEPVKGYQTSGYHWQ